MDHNEKKLILLKSIREEQEKNILRLQRREQILYPEQDISYRSLNRDNSGQNSYEYNTEANHKKHESYKSFQKNYKIQHKNSFIIRVMAALFLFLAYLYISNHHIQILNYSVADIQEMLTEDLELKSFAFMEQFSYTLKGLED